MLDHFLSNRLHIIVHHQQYRLHVSFDLILKINECTFFWCFITMRILRYLEFFCCLKLQLHLIFVVGGHHEKKNFDIYFNSLYCVSRNGNNTSRIVITKRLNIFHECLKLSLSIWRLAFACIYWWFFHRV